MKEEKKKLIKEAESVQANIDWWTEEISSACDAVDEIDFLPDISEEEIEERYRRLKYLISKTELEIEEINNLEAKYKKYINKFYETNKSGSTRLVRRKKRDVPQ